MRRSLHDAWWRLATTPPRSFTDQIVGGVLQLGAVLYGLGVRTRNLAYDRGWVRQARVPCPVISVGNLTVGGTGKTTCVELVVETLRTLGKRPCVLSRGHGGRRRAPYAVQVSEGRCTVDGQETTAVDGLADEPQLLAEHLEGVPVIVGRRREETGKRGVDDYHADVIVLDDGMQYRRLARECEIVLLQARMPLGGWPLLPRGPMREPLGALRRADVILLTKADQSLDVFAALQERIQRINPDALVLPASHDAMGLWAPATRAVVPLPRLDRMRVGLISSIGDPEGFERTMTRLGATVCRHAMYPDHYPYTQADWQQALRQVSQGGAQAIITTEKDAIRLRPWLAQGSPEIPVWILRIRMRLLEGDQRFHDRLARVCAR